MKNIFIGKKNKSPNKTNIVSPMTTLEDTSYVFSDIQIPLQASTTIVVDTSIVDGQLVNDTRYQIDDAIDYTAINNALDMFFNKDCGVGRALYMSPEFGSEIVDYFRDVSSSDRKIVRAQELIQRDIAKISRITTISALSFSYDSNKTLTTAGTITLNLTYSNSKIGSTSQWSGLVYQESV